MTERAGLPLGVNLRRLMDKKGLNPRSLSLAAGLNAWAVRDILSGKSREPLHSTVERLAEALGCEIWELTATPKMQEARKLYGEVFIKDDPAEQRRQRLRDVMVEHKLTPAKWAEKAGIRSTAIYNFLNGHSDSLSMPTIEKLARAVDLPVADVIADSSIAETNAPALRLRNLRNRAGLSMADMAKALDMAGASSYQRYEDPDLFTKNFLPWHITKRVAALLVGKGSPPITRAEVFDLSGIAGSDFTSFAPEPIDDTLWRLVVDAHRKIERLEKEIASMRQENAMQALTDQVQELGMGYGANNRAPAEPARRLKIARERAGLATGTDAANMLGVSVPTYLAHENGTRGFPIETAKAYATAFKVKASWLLGLDEGSD
jgi:transcriptional regulator with XRE-family HTH domain